MKKISSIIIVTLILFTNTLAWSKLEDKRIFHINSWKKGKSKIQETKLLIELNNKTPKFKTKIKGIDGKDKYELKVVPKYGKTKNELFAWKLSLTQGIFNKELLRVSEYKDEYQDYFDYHDYIADLALYQYFDIIEGDSGGTEGFPFVPLLDKRSITIESFDFNFQVIDFGVKDRENLLFDFVKIEASFVNKH